MPQRPEQSNNHEGEYQRQLFHTGELFVSSDAADVASRNGGSMVIVYLVERHVAMDGGNLPDEDKQQNQQGLVEGGRIATRFDLPSGDALYVTTISNRSATVVQTPFEFEQNKVPLFPLGQTLMGREGAEIIERNGGLRLAQELLFRHQTGDFGDMDEEDLESNRRALRVGERVFSAYILESGEKLWVITEADRHCTTIISPSEY